MTRIFMTLMFAALLLGVGACSDSSTNMYVPDVPGLDGDKTDLDHDTDTDREPAEEVAEEEEAEPECAVGEMGCVDAQHTGLCNDQGKWDVVEICLEGQTCRRGVCDPPLTDGDETEEETEAEPEVVHCTQDTDCEYGSGCDALAPGTGCVLRMECQTDANCNEGYLCKDAPNWKVCVKANHECQTDADCTAKGFGYLCQLGEDRVYHCVDNNECQTDVDCTTEGDVCKTAPTRRVCQADGKDCVEHTDCPYGYKCDTSYEAPICVYASTCKVDKDCATYELCAGQANWKQCQLDTSFKFCQTDAQCTADQFCSVVIGGQGICKSRNECSQNADCEEGFACKTNGTYLVCTEVPPCTNDASCGFGYKCVASTPKNVCQYANQCKSDADCNATQDCAASGNYTTCQFAMPGICTNDEGCAADEYCNTLIASLGQCRSRDQCFVDADCGDNMQCKETGEGAAAYNTCVSANPQSCWFDFQCANGWVCVNSKCTPTYDGMCEQVEGLWTVALATGTLCLGVTTGQQFEFVPKEGCSGGIRLTGQTINFGTFAKQADPSDTFDIKLLAVLNCTAEVPMASTLMTVTCGDSCTINLLQLTAR